MVHYRERFAEGACSIGSIDQLIEKGLFDKLSFPCQFCLVPLQAHFFVAMFQTCKILKRIFIRFLRVYDLLKEIKMSET